MSTTCSRDTSTISDLLIGAAGWALQVVVLSRTTVKYRTEKAMSKRSSKGQHNSGFLRGKKGKYLVRTVGVFRGLTLTDFQWEV